MLYGKDTRPVQRNLVATHSEFEKKITIPTVVSGQELALHFSQGTFEGEKVQPCTLDVVVDSFATKTGKLINVVQPGEEVIAQSSAEFIGTDVFSEAYIGHGLNLCVETRSRAAARIGLTCMGFWENEKLVPYLRKAGTLDFVLKNLSDLPIILDESFAPVQIWGIKELAKQPYHHANVKIIYDGEDVTEQRRILLGEHNQITGYVVTLAEGMSYFKTDHKQQPLTREQIKQRETKGTIEDIFSVKPDFCLTSTAEEVVTNGHPVYMLPFHYLDFVQATIRNQRVHWHDFFLAATSDHDKMLATVNAGVHNPGCSGTIVYESVTTGRDLEKYFRVGEPFGIVIALPYWDGRVDSKSYHTSGRTQNGVVTSGGIRHK